MSEIESKVKAIIVDNSVLMRQKLSQRQASQTISVQILWIQ